MLQIQVQSGILGKMDLDIKDQIAKGAYTSLIDSKSLSQEEYKIAILDNSAGKAPLSDVIAKNLRICRSFIFSVAFISQSGIEAIIQPLKEALDNGAEGYILTTDYLAFSEPDAIRRLDSLGKSIRVKVITEEAFHTKGYLFRCDGISTVIVGSSNLTQGALKTNHEWNVRITSTQNGSYVDEFESAFFCLWNKARPVTSAWLEQYRSVYDERRRFERILRTRARGKEEEIKPNRMQSLATESLKRIRREGKNKALIIAATGTGKTFLSCFDVKEYNPRRMLFAVHREQILKNAAESFKQVLGRKIGKDIGFLAGGKYEVDKKYVFATINSLLLAVEKGMIARNWFDYIIIDEVHRAGAPSYRRILDYFVPDFLLGMSATPDRTDRVNIYSLFDYSIACDIRLREALENDLLCPFHYFGVTDIMVDGKMLDENSDFRCLVSRERVRNILEKSRFYGHSGPRVKGLIFCSRNAEAEELSALMNQEGYRTAAVSGSTPVEKRLEYTMRLEQNEEDGRQLDFLLSVDVFNEGVDIPKVNQVIMLRPTESSIIFIQQLGRGLRKDSEKDFLVVIDFIANYKKNYLIPAALSGDASYSKDNLRRDSLDCSRLIPGCSTVNFDPVARKLIYNIIDDANFSDSKFLKTQYDELKNKIGRIPKIRDFREDRSIDIQRFVDKYDSYYAFLEKNEKDFKIRLSETEKCLINYVSKCFSEGKRDEELRIIERIVKDKGIKQVKNISPSAKASLDLSFLKSQDREGRFRNARILESDGSIAESFIRSLSNRNFSAMLMDIVDDALIRYRDTYSRKYRNTDLVLYARYSYEDVFRLLGWQRNENALNIGGYKYDEKTKTLPVFINYVKDADAIKYEDRFLSNRELIALSKKPRKADSPDADHIYKRTSEDKGNMIYLFVRKNKRADSKKEFYFLGEMEAKGKPKDVTVNGMPAFEIDYILLDPVRDDIYEYIIADI